MPDQNSYAEFILGIFRKQLVDCLRWYPELTKEFDRDFLRLSSALNSHGIRFALDTMPAFRKHFDKCLSERLLTPSHFTNFGVVKKGEAIPRLFRGLTSRVFERNGRLKDRPDIQAIKLIRQLLGVMRKLKFAANIKDCGNAVQEFYRDDMDVRRGDLSWDHHISFQEEVGSNDAHFYCVINPDNHLFTDLRLESEAQTSVPIRDLRGALDVVQRVADLTSSTLGSFDPHEWVFKHGPGSVAGTGFGSYKYDFKTWPERLDSVFPYADFAVANFASVDAESIEVARARGFFHEQPAVLHAVPKTVKAPRLIASEPACLQWCQQAIRDYFYVRVEKSFLSKFIDFRRQELNGDLALRSSLNGSHSTIDLKSASDRISCWHVERLFRRSPSLLKAMQASRSTWIKQDICKYSPGFHRLRKYSTQGNATTFPVQSVFFCVLALASVLIARKQSVTFRHLAALAKDEVRVFGDDIIVPTDASGILVGLLRALDLRVNDSKTFSEGNFRESCGVDAFEGKDVTSVSIMELPRRSSPSSIVSSVDIHNNLLSAGYEDTARLIRQTASFPSFRKIREVKYGDGAFGWWVFGVPNWSGFRTRVSKALQSLEILCLGLISKASRSPAEGNPGLLQFFTEAAKKVTSAKSTLGYLDRRPANKLVLRWASTAYAPVRG